MAEINYLSTKYKITINIRNEVNTDVINYLIIS